MEERQRSAPTFHELLSAAVAPAIHRKLEANDAVSLILVGTFGLLEFFPRFFGRVPVGRVVEIVCAGSSQRRHCARCGRTDEVGLDYVQYSLR